MDKNEIKRNNKRRKKQTENKKKDETLPGKITNWLKKKIYSTPNIVREENMKGRERQKVVEEDRKLRVHLREANTWLIICIPGQVNVRPHVCMYKCEETLFTPC